MESLSGQSRLLCWPPECQADRPRDLSTLEWASKFFHNGFAKVSVKPESPGINLFAPYSLFCTLKHKAPERRQLASLHRRTELGEPSLPLVSDIRVCQSWSLSSRGNEAWLSGCFDRVTTDPVTGSVNLQTLCKRQVRSKCGGGA